MEDQKTQVLLDAFANASAESRKPYPFPGLESVFEGRAGYSNPHANVRSVQKCLSLKEGTEKGEWCELAGKFLDWKCAHPGDHLPAKPILNKVARSAVRESRVATRPEPSASSGSVIIDQATLVQFIDHQKEQMALFQQAVRSRTPLAIEDGSSERLTRMEDKLDAVRDAAVQNLVDCAGENGVEDAAVEKMIEDDDGTLEEKAVAKIIEDDVRDVVQQAVEKMIEDDDGTLAQKAIENMIEEDDGDLEEHAIQKLTLSSGKRKRRSLFLREKRRSESPDTKRARTAAQTAPVTGGGDVTSAQVEDELGAAEESEEEADEADE